MDKINRWMIQEDKEGNFIIYPIPMLPIKGYIAPDEAAAIKFTNNMYPIIGLGFGALMLAGHFGDFYLSIALLLYFFSIILINLYFVKNYPVSKRKYSWKYYAYQMNKKMSISVLCLCLCGGLLFCCMILYDFIYHGNKSIGMYVYALSFTIYVFFMYLLIFFYRIKSLF